MDHLKWVASAGGPLALLAKKELSRWVGCFGKLTFGTNQYVWEKDLTYPNKTHYDSVCEFDGLIGVMVIDGIQVIILGDEPATTAWHPLFHEDGGILIRWIYANGMEAVNDLLERIPYEGWTFETEVIIQSSEWVLFDSAAMGMEVDEVLPLRLQSGKYEFSSLEYHPDDQTHFRLHRIRRRSN